MKVKALFAGLLVVLLGTAGCAQTQVPGASDAGRSVVRFEATASSVVARPDDPLALEEASVAAAAMAKANLLSKIKGEQMTSTVRVSDLMFAGQEVSARSEGFLARATVTLREPEARAQEPRKVTAVATLELTNRELENLDQYVQ